MFGITLVMTTTVLVMTGLLIQGNDHMQHTDDNVRLGTLLYKLLLDKLVGGCMHHKYLDALNSADITTRYIVERMHLWDTYDDVRDTSLATVLSVTTDPHVCNSTSDWDAFSVYTGAANVVVAAIDSTNQRRFRYDAGLIYSMIIVCIVGLFVQSMLGIAYYQTPKSVEAAAASLRVQQQLDGDNHLFHIIENDQVGIQECLLASMDLLHSPREARILLQMALDTSEAIMRRCHHRKALLAVVMGTYQASPSVYTVELPETILRTLSPSSPELRQWVPDISRYRAPGDDPS